MAARARRLGSALALSALCLAPAAKAQVSGSLALSSDYRLRGVSLTDRRPAVSASLAYDHPSGFYAGGVAIADDPARRGRRMVGHMEYAGFAWRGERGPSWDVGVSNVDVGIYLDREIPIHYTQAYVGVAQGPVSARLSVAPDYPRKGRSTAYAEVNGALRPAENWRVWGHAGALARLGGSERREGRRDRYDVTVGLAREFGRWELQVSGTAVSPRPEPKASTSLAGVAVAAVVFF